MSSDDKLRSDVVMPGTIKPPSPDRAVRLLRAKGAELEAIVLAHRWEELPAGVSPVTLAADIALIAQLLADHIERSNASQVLYEAHVENLIERVYALEGGDEPIVTKTGKVLTDEDIQALADEAEAGYDVEKLKKRR